jgi:hypothetical protein
MREHRDVFRFGLLAALECAVEGLYAFGVAGCFGRDFTGIPDVVMLHNGLLSAGSQRNRKRSGNRPSYHLEMFHFGILPKIYDL